MKNNNSQEIRALEIKAILSQPRQKFQGVGAGIHDKVLYYGTNVHHNKKELTAIITSDRKIYFFWDDENDEIRDEFGLNFRYDFFGDLLKYDVSNETIKNFLENKETKTSIKEAFYIILEKQKTLVWHYEPGYSEAIACDILSSYFIPIFASKGRAFFNADAGFGKTQQLSVYAGLSFHPLLSGNMSGASIYRIIESIKPTILVDDFDKIPEEQKTSFDQSLRVGYKKGLKAIRTDDKRPIGFDLYSHMVINNIGGMDEVSESRCTKHNLMKCPNNFNPKEAQDETDKWQNDRDRLWVCGLSNWKEVQENYKTIKIDKLRNRELERDKATLTIAKMVSPVIYEKVLSYLLKCNEERAKTEVEYDWFFQVVKWWKTQKCPLWIKPATIAEEIASDCIASSEEDFSYKKQLKSLAWHIGKNMKKFPIIKTRLMNGYCEYYLTEENWKRIVRAKGWEVVFELVEQSPLTTPTTLTTLTTPNTPKKEDKNCENEEMPLNASMGEKVGVLGVLSGLSGDKGATGKEKKEAVS